VTLPDTNKAIVTTMVAQGLAKGDFDAVLAAYAPDFVYHNPVVDDMPDLSKGLTGMRMLLAGARQAFPDMRYRIESVVAEGDRVALLYSWTGTHLGSIGGIPATGTSVTATGAIFCRLADAQIVEQWDLDDRLGTMQQLGVIPSMSTQQ
jgi:steroid delta-isomerase-like uncharacterized protein